MERERWAFDVDGVILGLMEGWARWLDVRAGIKLDVSLIRHRSAANDKYAKLVVGDPGRSLSDFLNVPDVYRQWCLPIPGAVEVVQAIAQKHDAIFMTAVLWTAPKSYESKAVALEELFPKMRIGTMPSSLKHWVKVHKAVDDRADTCQRWTDEGTMALNFRQPWSMAPPDMPGYDWDGIARVAGV